MPKELKRTIKNALFKAFFQGVGCFPPFLYNGEEGRTFKKCPICKEFLFLDRLQDELHFGCGSETCKKLTQEEFDRKWGNFDPWKAKTYPVL
jgi:hypothetical protein